MQLLDVVRRLDAATVGGFSDGLAEGEATALRLLVNVSAFASTTCMVVITDHYFHTCR